MALTPKTVDVVFGTPDQTPPDHAGPVGRIKRLVNAEVIRYIAPGPGQQPKNQLDQRNGFESLSKVVRKISDGTLVSSPNWDDPTVLSHLSDQLVSVCGKVPRVYNGDHWGLYDENVVVANTLSQKIIHTGNHLVAAPDSARIGSVTCNVYQEFNPSTQAYDSYVSFIADDGAVIVQPRKIYTADTTHPGLARVVADTSQETPIFWVVCEDSLDNQLLRAIVYSTAGELRASTTFDRTWDLPPGYFDVIQAPAVGVTDVQYEVQVAQPGTFDPETDCDVVLDFFHYNGVTIDHEAVAVPGANCQGPVAWLANDTGNIARAYLATLGTGGPGVGQVFVYELASGLVQHEYSIANIENEFPDSITGYVDAGLTAHVAISQLSQGAPGVGPLNDPALRRIMFWTSPHTGGSTVFVKASQSLIAVTRAFKINGDWFLVGYYQSGAGILKASEFVAVTHASGDYMFGAPEQRLADPQAGDYTAGGPVQISPIGGGLFLTQAIASITHNAGDSATAATATWVFNNATFVETVTTTAQYSILNITGSSHPGNNTSYRIIKVVNATTIITSPIGANGVQMQDDTLAGVTASLTATIVMAFRETYNGRPISPDVPTSLWSGASVVVTGMAVSANNTTYTTYDVLQGADFGVFPATSAPFTVIICHDPAGTQVSEYFSGSSHLAVTPTTPNLWFIPPSEPDDSWDGQILHVSGALPGNNGDFPITGHTSNSVTTASQPGQVAQDLGNPPQPALTLVLANPGQAYTFHLGSVTFDESYLGAFIVVNNVISFQSNSGTYIISQIVDSHTVIAQPASGRVGQVNETFPAEPDIRIQKPLTSQLPNQPAWFLVDFVSPQPISGEWEIGIAYADWRLDGEPTGFPNQFIMELTSVPTDASGASIVLPYRAQSFTAGQVFDGGIQTAQENTVGLKRFVIGPSPGIPIQSEGAMLLPGPLSTAFTLSGFAENNVSLGPEKPFLVDKHTSTAALVLTLNATYQYVVVFEGTDENGDRTLSKPSPALSVTLSGTENEIVLGGRILRPTNHKTVGIAIYRTAIIGGVSTTEHYKITNDLDVNGAGFEFATIGLGPAQDTWEFTDSIPDSAITQAEQLYTDRGLAPRFPAPAFSSGVGTFRGRTWVIGYDGAVWLSGEKTEGDAVWFNPLLRIPLPVDDGPTGIAVLDDYLVIGCRETMRYLAPGTLPDAGIHNGLLPTPIDLPFPNGCNGAMATIRAGVAYGSTAGGLWVLSRSLVNDWLSQPLQEDVPAVKQIAIDDKQRMFVATGINQLFVYDMVCNIWSRYDIVGETSLITHWNGAATYEDETFVCTQRQGYADVRGTFLAPIGMEVTLAGVSFGSVRGWRRWWAAQLVGQYHGPHQLTVGILEPDEDGPPGTVFRFNPSATKPYIYEFNPSNEEAGSWDIELQVSFPGILTPGRAATWELITAEVGIESGIARLPATSRIPRTE